MDFWLNFENYITDPETWEIVFSLLSEDSLIVQKLEDRNVYLQSGAIPNTEEQDREFIKDFEAYWAIHPAQHPFKD